MNYKISCKKTPNINLERNYQINNIYKNDSSYIMQTKHKQYNSYLIIIGGIQIICSLSVSEAKDTREKGGGSASCVCK